MVLKGQEFVNKFAEFFLLANSFKKYSDEKIINPISQERGVFYCE
jgi:hypothetical protein